MALDVTPASLRDAAAEYFDAGDQVIEASGMGGSGSSPAIGGAGRNTSSHLSPQLFRPGATAQQLLSEAVADFGIASRTMIQNCMGLASALNLLADVYSTTDHHDALQFAFLRTDDKPAGIPEHIGNDETIGDLMEGEEVSPEGGGAGEADSNASTVHVPAAGLEDGVSSHTKIVTTDDHGNLQSVRHEVEYVDGTAEYYNHIYDENGGYEREDTLEVDDPQPNPMPPGYAAQQDMSSQLEAAQVPPDQANQPLPDGHQ